MSKEQATKALAEMFGQHAEQLVLETNLDSRYLGPYGIRTRLHMLVTGNSWEEALAELAGLPRDLVGAICDQAARTQ